MDRHGDGDLPKQALGHLELSKQQIGLLAVLVGLVALVGFVNFVSTGSLRDRTEELNYQLQRVSGDRVSLERQVLLYALTVERWADGDLGDDDLLLERGLTERQRLVTIDDALDDPVVAPSMIELMDALERTDELVAAGRPMPGSDAEALLASTLDEMILSAKSLFDRNEGQNIELVRALERQLERSDQLEVGVICVMLVIVGLLVWSVRRMLRSNYRVAAAALRHEHQRYRAAQGAMSRVHRQYREVVDEVTDVVFRCDEGGHWTLLNRAWETLTGVPVEEALGTRAIEYHHVDDRERLRRATHAMLAGTQPMLAEGSRIVRPDGSVRDVVVSGRAAVDLETGERYLTGTINDVTERATAERLVRAQAEILELVALDVPTEAVLARVVELIEPHLPDIRLRFVVDDSRRDPTAVGVIEMSDLSRGGALGALEWYGVADEPEQVDAIVRLAARLGAVAVDRRLAAERMSHQANHDALTGLPNRNLLVDRIETALARARRRDSTVAVLFLDVDRFKLVNDSLGHGVGDGLLVEVSARLSSTVRAMDTVARFGGDEFVVLAEALDPADVRELADRILTTLSQPMQVDGHTITVTSSVGIVMSDGTATVGELLKSADVAMYRAKQTGRNRHELFDNAMERWVSERHATESALRGCLRNDELEVWYQPVIELGPPRLKGFEALVRWNRPGVGRVAPGMFIDVAEEIGMIHDIGAWVLDRAAEQLAVWRRRRPDLTMSVNVSGHELVRHDFCAQVARILERHEVDPSGIVLEITESVLLDDADAVLRRLAELRRLGLRFAIDDFGTGYSSLQYLRRLPVDVLKIDRVFVSGAEEGLTDATIVASVADLGHALGLEIVAEGIETNEQLAALHSLGVDSGQGFLLGRPMIAADADLAIDEALVASS
jgi:diguanylate cyclase (GGDEF)-like protein/PAS domain S-box-containing protein